jgi:hypothetical protein
MLMINLESLCMSTLLIQSTDSNSTKPVEGIQDSLKAEISASAKTKSSEEIRVKTWMLGTLICG